MVRAVHVLCATRLDRTARLGGRLLVWLLGGGSIALLRSAALHVVRELGRAHVRRPPVRPQVVALREPVRVHLRDWRGVAQLVSFPECLVLLFSLQSPTHLVYGVF